MSSQGPTFRDLLDALKTKRMFIVLLLGFSSGLPIMLVYSTLRIWLRREGIDLGTIGFLSWVAIPYSLNFLWAPLLDRFSWGRFGRRKTWILLAQLGCMASIYAIGFGDPQISVTIVVLLAFSIAFFSATQDIAVDAYRREILPDRELGVGAAIGVYGYRTAMLVASGLGLWVVDESTLNMTFNQSFQLISLFMLVGIIASLWANEPKLTERMPVTVHDSLIAPFKEFFSRKSSLYVLLLVFFFKFSEAIAGSMAGPFYVDVGFSNRDIAEVTKWFGFASTMAGLFIGGSIIYRFGILTGLWISAILQAVSTAVFSVLAFTGPNWWVLVGVIGFEDISGGMGTAALVAFMSQLASRRFTATQYALLSSLASLGRTFFSGTAGLLIEFMGYVTFFLFCCSLAIPTFLLLFKLTKSFGLTTKQPHE